MFAVEWHSTGRHARSLRQGHHSIPAQEDTCGEAPPQPLPTSVPSSFPRSDGARGTATAVPELPVQTSHTRVRRPPRSLLHPGQLEKVQRW